MRSLAALLGVLAVVVGVWALVAPDGFAAAVNFPEHRHFVHDVGAFQLGIGATLLLALIWADGLAVGLGGYLVGAVAHTVSHIVDRNEGGSSLQTWLIAVSALLAALALVVRWRELGCVLGFVAPTRESSLVPFGRQKTVALTTYRRDGTPVATPVSIAVAGDRAYVRSFERAWKTRRIAHNPAVVVAPSTARGVATGPGVAASARRLTGSECVVAARALRRKYPLLHGVLVPLMHRVGRRRFGRTVHFALLPSVADRAEAAATEARS